MGLQTLSAPSVFPLTLPCGSQCSVRWLALQASTSVLVRLWQSLSGDSYTRPLSASTSWHQNSVWVCCLQMGWIHRWGSLWMAFPSVSAPLFVPAFPFKRRNSGVIFLRWVAPSLNCGPCLTTGYGLYRF